MRPTTVRPARPDEGPLLREIAIQSKAHWGYPPEFLARFAALLRLDEHYFRTREVWAADTPTGPAGFYALHLSNPSPGFPATAPPPSATSLPAAPPPSATPLLDAPPPSAIALPDIPRPSATAAPEPAAAVLDDLWLRPAHIGDGLGRILFEHAALRAEAHGATRLEWEADPGALGFYRHMGARQTGTTLSSLGRSLPVLAIHTGPPTPTPARRTEVATLLARLPAWAASRPDIRVLALVGSYARNTPRANSDLDLVLITTTPAAYLDNTDWITDFNATAITRTQQWGPLLTERRLRCPSGLEIELGITTPTWAATNPIDPGTAQVLSDAHRILHDPDALLTTCATRPPKDTP